MAEALKTHGVIPDVIDTVPAAVVKVSYPTGVTVDLGKELTPTQVKDQPTVDWDADGSSFYTLCMTGEMMNFLNSRNQYLILKFDDYE